MINIPGGGRSRPLLRPTLLIKPLVLYFIIVLLLAVAFSLACGSGSAATPTPAGTATEAPPPSDANAIRLIDPESLPETQQMLAQFSGASIEEDEIIYADVTGDQREDAILPISSGGSLGNVAYVVFQGRADSSPKLILRRTMDRSYASGLVMHVESGKLVESVGVYGDDDPLCCPSQLRLTEFRWDGNVLQVEKEEVTQGQSQKQ